MISEIDANLFRQAIQSAYANLENNKQTVNNLNVFPVPDGDTGTNMALTLQYAVKEMDGSTANTVGELAFACSNGALMGARGNCFAGCPGDAKGKLF
jgi:dihydroxyacetone kinase-like predicted kinase